MQIFKRLLTVLSLTLLSHCAWASTYVGAGGDFNTNGSLTNSAIQILVTGTYLMDNGVNTFVKAGVSHQTSDVSLNNGSANRSNWNNATMDSLAAGATDLPPT